MRTTRRQAGGLALAAMLLVMSGCAYQGRGGVSIQPDRGEAATAAAKEEPSAMSARFDRVQTERIGEVYVFTAYRRPVNDRRTDDTGFHDFRRDPIFTAPELRVAIDTAGRIIEGPWLALRQGERVLVDGVLEGPIHVEPRGGVMVVTGTDLRWVISDDSLGWRDGPARLVSFDLTTPNVLTQPPATTSTAVSAATR